MITSTSLFRFCLIRMECIWITFILHMIVLSWSNRCIEKEYHLERVFLLAVFNPVPNHLGWAMRIRILNGSVHTYLIRIEGGF
jgi:hypothetical protein